MATATETPTKAAAKEGELRFVLWNIGWEGYSKLLEVFDKRNPRLSYLDGSVELMSPLLPHEQAGNLLAFLVEIVTEELDIPRHSVGSTTFRRRAAERGFEADKAYYIANAGCIPKGTRNVDLDTYPPPDLVIEIEITRSILDKLSIYAGLGVPEIWRYDGEAPTILLLGPEGTYQPSEVSRSFPFLPMADVARLLDEYDPADELGWVRAVRRWARENLLPIHRPGGDA